MQNESFKELKIKLGKLAQAAIDRKASRFRLNEYLGTSDDEKSLLKLALNLGWLNQVGRDTEKITIYAFANTSLAENLAAKVIDDWDFFLPRSHKNKPIENQRYRIFEAQWKQTILFWFERKDVPKEEKEAFILALRAFDDGCVKYEGKGFYGYRAYFLAAAAIAKFEECDQADKIVKRIVNWKLNYSRFRSIQEEATLALQETNRTKAISVVVQLLDTSQDEYSRNFQVAKSLWDIYPHKDRLISISYDCCHLAECLENIDPGNKKSIAVLVELLDTSLDDLTRWLAAESLGNIDPGNEKSIAVLIQILDTTRYEDAFYFAARSLSNIGSGNEKVIPALAQLLNPLEEEDEFTPSHTTKSLENIDPNNEKTIAALAQSLDTLHNSHTRRLVVDILGKIDPSNEKTIAALAQLLNTSQNEDTRLQAAESLGEIDPGNETAITALAQLLDTSQNEDTRCQVAYKLGEIGIGNETAITALVQLLDTSQNEDTRLQAAESLGKIDPGNEKAIAALVQLFDTSPYEEYIQWAAESLGNICFGNEKAIAALVQLFDTSQNEYTRKKAVKSLRKIDPGNKDGSVLIQALHRYELDRNCYHLIWKYAQNLPYPDFYHAWHQS